MTSFRGSAESRGGIGGLLAHLVNLQVIKFTPKDSEREHTIYLWVTPLEKK